MPVLQVAKSGQPYTTIQAAMLAAVDGDTIRVMDSQTYQDGQVRFDTPVPTLDNVTIEAAVGQTPTIKGTSNELIDFGYTTGNVVDGFTVDCTGSGSNYGLSFEDTSQSCIISDCTLTNCRSKFSEQAQGNKVLRCKFTGVSQFRVQNTAGLTENQFIACEFSGFTSSAIIMLSGGTTGVYGCTIDGGDSATAGIDDDASAGNLTITNTIITRCTTQLDTYAGTDKSKVTFSCLKGQSLTGFPGSNINTDPVFVNPSNRRLQASSPCLNTGTSLAAIYTVDLDGDAIAGSYEMGAYEGTGGGPTLTYHERTIAASGANHTTIASFKQWIIDNVHATDLTAANAHVTAIFTDSSTFTEAAIQFTWTADADRTIVFKAAAGATPNINTPIRVNVISARFEGLKMTQVSNNYCVQIDVSNVRVTTTEFVGHTTPAFGAIRLSAGTGSIIDRCLFNGGKYGFEQTASGGAAVRNCIFKNHTGRSLSAIVGSGTCSTIVEHCTIDAASNGVVAFVQLSVNVFTVRNCLLKADGSGAFVYYVNTTDASRLASNYNTTNVVNSATTGRTNSATYVTLANWQGTGQDANSVDTAIPWTNEAGGDYTLTASTDGFDYGVTTDYNAGPRAVPGDKGALEYQAIPAAPSGLSVTPASTTQLNLTWTDNATNESAQEIERAPDSGGAPGTFALVASVSANDVSYSDTGLSASTTYWYRIRAYNEYGFSAYSANASGTTNSPAAVGGGATMRRLQAAYCGI